MRIRNLALPHFVPAHDQGESILRLHKARVEGNLDQRPK